MENDTKQSSCSPLPFGFYNMDCMTGMKCFPDKYFDLAIVDPVYGYVTNGGYMKNQIRGGVGPYKDYDLSIWQQQKTGQEYFDELFRVSRNQIIWGGELLSNLHIPEFPMLGCLGQTPSRWNNVRRL